MNLMSLYIIDKNLVVKIECDIDHHVADKIKEKIERQIELSNLKNIIFDLEKVYFMDSSGIGLIMGRYRMMRLVGGGVRIDNVPAHLDRIIALSGVRQITQ